MIAVRALLSRLGVVVVGGCQMSNETDCLSTCEFSNGIFDKFRADNVRFPQMNEKRRSPSLFHATVDGLRRLIVAGGCSSLGRHCNSVEVLKDMSCEQTTPRHWEIMERKFEGGGVSCAAFCQLENGTFFIAGGYNGKDCLSDVYLLNGIDNLFSISRLKPLPSQLKNAAALSTLSQGNEPQILIIGGWDESRTLRSIFQYTIYENGQQECLVKGVMPVALEGHTVTRFPSSTKWDAIICGGYDGVGVVNSIYRFSTKTLEMQLVPEQSLRIARENHATVVVVDSGRKYLVVIGGWDGHTALADCEVFELLDGELALLKRVDNHHLKLVTARNRPAAVCF